MVFKRGSRIFLIFHIVVPLIVFELPFIKKRFEFNRFALIIGSLFPDIIDKSMLFLNLGSGRGISHTILFVVLGFIILHMAIKKRSYNSLPFFIGMLFHLLLDLPEVPLFYPFVMYDFLILEDPFGYWTYRLFNDPVIYLTELLGFSLLIFIVIKNKLYNLEAINWFLFEKSLKLEQDL